jgi:hypothetical protein
MSLTHNSLGSVSDGGAQVRPLHTPASNPFQTAIRFRLREAQPVALPVTRCSCGHALDEAATQYIHCRGAPGVGGGNFFTSIHDAMLVQSAGRVQRQLMQQARAGAATSKTRANRIAKNVDAVRPRLVPCCKMLCVHTSGTQGSRLAAGGVNTINYREMWV